MAGLRSVLLAMVLTVALTAPVIGAVTMALTSTGPVRTVWAPGDIVLGYGPAPSLSDSISEAGVIL